MKKKSGWKFQKKEMKINFINQFNVEEELKYKDAKLMHKSNS